jgi:hypothetical protein
MTGRKKRARKLADQFMKGASLTKDPEITAMALNMVSRHLPKMLVTEWPHVAGEALVDLVRDISPDDADRIEQALEFAL